MAGYQNKEIKTPVHVPLQDVMIGTFTEDYHLSEVEFERIKTGQPKTLGLAISLLGITIGFAVASAPDAIDQGWSAISPGVLKTFCALAIVTATLFILGWLMPNERKATLKIIGEHFKSTKPRKQAMERERD